MRLRSKHSASFSVKWAWQMAEMSDEDWRSFEVPIGIKTAVRAELASPSSDSNANLPMASDDMLSNERLRRFLLIPSANGKAVEPIHSVSAMFLGLLTVPRAERQNLMLALCELLALIGGLILPITLEFRRGANAVALPDEKGWHVPPTLVDVMDAAALAIFCLNIMIIFFCVGFATFVVAGAYQPDDEFTEDAALIMASLFAAIFLGLLVPIWYLAMWHAFTDSASPYAAMGGIALMLVPVYVLNHIWFKFILEHWALEVYHSKFFQSVAKQNAPLLRHLLTDEALRPRAEKRAAKLRERLIRDR